MLFLEDRELGTLACITSLQTVCSSGLLSSIVCHVMKLVLPYPDIVVLFHDQP